MDYENNMTKQYQQFIAKPEISFWVPIISSAVMLAISFMALSNKVDLANQNIAQVLEQQKTLIAKYEAVQVRLGTAENKLSVIESEHRNFSNLLSKLK